MRIPKYIQNGLNKRYGPYHNKQTGHMFWIEIDPEGHRRSIWAHREILEKKLARKLEIDEVVHHLNQDPTDNRPENLEAQLRASHARGHRKPEEMGTTVCLNCGKTLLRPQRLIRRAIKKGRAGLCCDQHCAGTWSRQRQLDRGQVNLRCCAGVSERQTRRPQKSLV